MLNSSARKNMPTKKRKRPHKRYVPFYLNSRFNADLSQLETNFSPKFCDIKPSL